MKSRLICGIMSGTSLDGVDTVLVRVRGKGTRTKVEQLAFVQQPFPRRVRSLLLKNSSRDTSNVEDISRLNFLLAELYADGVKAVARKARVRMDAINLIGSHGQTMSHLPGVRRIGGRSVRATLQIGDPSVLATLTKIPTVGDFRVADVAAGGQGAPLVPFFDWLMFRSRKRNRLLLNIGGIANVTVLPAGCPKNKVIAFDTGPGNMVVDSLMKEKYGRPFDRDGRVAFRGEAILSHLQWMMSHRYFAVRPPKSTGREEFGDKFVTRLNRRTRKMPKEDVISTASFLTPLSVYESYRRFIRRRMSVDELIVSGGGARNDFFMRVLGLLFGEGVVKTTDEFNVSIEAKEAICFAVLANETWFGNTTNLPSVTGARREVVLGKICRP